ncbi:MAG: hypothetical protein EON59_09500 [Alphaproteobacteria bacterium]|nr:MAG: hypothetical protein EON59_09500 [Alphaproteobacteria bacterium]
MAQSFPVCSAIAPVSPAAGAHFLGSRPIMFQWSGEPVGTANRELHLARLDGSETVIPLDGRFSDTVKVKMPGDLGWAVVFRDANGKVLCTSLPGVIRAGAGTSGAGTTHVSPGASSLSTPGGASAPAVAVVYMNNGRLVIVLQNSPYAGSYTKLVASNDYDGTNEDLMGASGLEIHGNDAPNRLFGSAGSDLIYGYDSGDYIDPGPGQDEIFLGGAPTDPNAFYTRDGQADVVNLQVGTWTVAASTSPTETIVNGDPVGRDAGDQVNFVVP